MPTTLETAISQLDNPEDEQQLNALDAAMAGVSSATVSSQEIKQLLAIFERFPNSDGFGVFWSIIHFLNIQ